MGGVWVNDVHSKLNATWVREVVPVRDEDDVLAALERARRAGLAVSLAGGRHSMGSQAFGTGTLLLDLRGLNRVRRLDLEAGRVEVEAGICWPELISALRGAQDGRRPGWGIIQKQTGADRLTLGGALAANVHGRGLRLRPFVDDVHSATVVGPDGEGRLVSRQENAELFRLVAGGYGLFGVVTRLTLRLMPRLKLERVVELGTTDDLAVRFEQRLADGFLYGDFQFAIDPQSDDFLRRGVFSCYRPADPETPMTAPPRELGPAQWQRLLRLAHQDPGRAFAEYAAYYRSTSGQVYWSDTHQLTTYLDDYHSSLDRAGDGPAGSEMITEVYVPRHALAGFLAEARAALRSARTPVVYGTIRLIERDAETFLAWAREPWACVVFNLHVVHDPSGLTRAAEAFRALIDLALYAGGTYYLTYHRWARRDQVLRAYPQFLELLRWKSAFDPEDRIQSDWYRHHRALLEERRIA